MYIIYFKGSARGTARAPLRLIHFKWRVWSKDETHNHIILKWWFYFLKSLVFFCPLTGMHERHIGSNTVTRKKFHICWHNFHYHCCNQLHDVCHKAFIWKPAPFPPSFPMRIWSSKLATGKAFWEFDSKVPNVERATSWGSRPFQKSFNFPLQFCIVSLFTSSSPH